MKKAFPVQRSAKIYAFPAKQLPEPRPAPQLSIAELRNLERLRRSRQLVREAAIHALASAGVSIMFAFAAYVFSLAGTYGDSAVLAVMGALFFIAALYFAVMGWREYAESSQISTWAKAQR